MNAIISVFAVFSPSQRTVDITSQNRTIDNESDFQHTKSTQHYYYTLVPSGANELFIRDALMFNVNKHHPMEWPKVNKSIRTQSQGPK